MFPPHYYEYRKRKKKQNFFILPLMFSAIICIVFLLLPKENSQAEEVLKQQEAIILQKTATLKLSTLYTCGHQKTRMFPLPEELNKKSESQVQKVHPEWKILRFEEQIIEAEEKVETDCDNHFLLKLTANRIIVTKKNTPKEIIMEEKIDPAILTKEDKEILLNGIYVNSEYELLEIMESFR